MTHYTKKLFRLAAGGAAAGEDRAKRDMIVRSTRPEDLEMPLSGFSDYITPIEHFFVRTHVYVPTVNLSDWRLKVEGEVANAAHADHGRSQEDARRRTGRRSRVRRQRPRLLSSLRCPGLQWSYRKRRQRPLARRPAGGCPEAGRHQEHRLSKFCSTAPTSPSEQCRISAVRSPRKKALDPNTLLAYEMNGETLPVKHGFPLRVVAPGWASDSWVKWLTSITVLDKEFDGFWMKNAYRQPGPSGRARRRADAGADGPGDQPAGEKRHRLAARWCHRSARQARHDSAASPGAATPAPSPRST